jgi:hypothetical protein
LIVEAHRLVRYSESLATISGRRRSQEPVKVIPSSTSLKSTNVPSGIHISF